MAVWSALSRTLFGAQRASNVVLSQVAVKNGLQLRQMSGHNKFIIQPTRWQWHKFKDLLHLYFFVGAIPLGLISAYCNLFIGPAELAPIPEGYRPQEHEYYRHPITRFFKKYIMESEQESYERHMHFLWEHYDQAMFRKIQKEVMALQESRGDYKHWYYVPVETRTYEIMQEDAYETHQERGQFR
ncbi:hypothetical protein ONE63_001846 [Megalurothrips usitatus]|uniref:NADH dehydrogenase [ubiquinone] 1 beta subcomplex subunit 5, mitochondrial n=1 Tax=Megalurothrips usitatus TaxID=439358 RepID=A0AAV7XGY2_9NEOP|nr:hypothetical protein ONE63_001846 [Megalurothrips usitatus]